jgi:hypothetical protein
VTGLVGEAARHLQEFIDVAGIRAGQQTGDDEQVARALLARSIGQQLLDHEIGGPGAAHADPRRLMTRLAAAGRAA